MSRVPYSSTFDRLMYAMVCKRPYIAHVVGGVSRYMNNLGKEHWEEEKCILRYLRGTPTHALCFGGSNIVLQGYLDSDMASDKDSRMSTTGNVFYCRWNKIKLDFKTTKVCCTFNNRGRVCCCYKG
jgi:hypothetical protein